MSRRIAFFVVHQRRRLFGIALGLVLLCAVLMAVFLRPDAEVLNLLPDSFDSVQSLKVFNREFSQARELTFAIYDESGEADLDGFREQFAEALKREAWVSRVLDRSPMEDPSGVADVQSLALPLLFNLPEADFRDAIGKIEPAAITERLARFRADIEAGSMKAEMQLSVDPLGLVLPALKPLAGGFSMEQSQPLTSKDGKLQLVFVQTTQKGLNPFACREMMDNVEALRTKLMASWQGRAPELLVTGRTPYVAEMSRGMEHDIISTLLGSVLLVAGVFYFGFRRFLPLIGIMHALLFCCILAVAAGAVVFGRLNGIAVGFCSILVGLGVDFGMLLYGAYVMQRDQGRDHEEAVAVAISQLGRGICFGAATTAAGFLVLMLSGCPGFAQLGVLIAVGILFAAATMMTVFFALLPSQHHIVGEDLLSRWCARFIRYARQNSRGITIGVLVVFGLACLVALLPVGNLKFDADPKSLEPAGSKAGRALRIIQEKITAGAPDPVLVLISADNAEQFHEWWAAAQAKWSRLVQAGVLRSANSPAPFALSPARLNANRTALQGRDFGQVADALRAAVQAQGFSMESFAPAFTMLDQLSAIAKGGQVPADLAAVLPENSAWRFVLDKFLSNRDRHGVAYLLPKERLTDLAAQKALLSKVTVENVPMHPTGWSLVQNELKPWARSKLVLLSAAMVVFNILLLLFLYRRLAPLLALMGALALSIGAMVATVKFFAIPLNLFNVLAFPLVLGVGVDYGIYILLAMRDQQDQEAALKMILKPVLLSGLTSIAGFGSLAFAYNPSLSGLGIVCAIGIAWSLFATIFLIVPANLWRRWT